MPTAQYTALANTTLASAATSVTFTSIAGTYRDLMLVVAGQLSGADNQIFLRFNGDTASNYSNVSMEGNGSTAASNTGTLTGIVSSVQYNSFSGTSQSNLVAHIMDYAVTDKHKTGLVRGNSSALDASAVAGRWANTAAITSLTVYSFTGTYQFAAGTTMALYGVK